MEPTERAEQPGEKKKKQREQRIRQWYKIATDIRMGEMQTRGKEAIN